MKPRAELHELYYTDSDVFLKILQLLRKSYGKEITKFLIYTDENYLNYLRKISLDRQNTFIYYLKDPMNDEFMGFAYFKKLNSSLFLNHIIIEPKFKNNGLGKYLLFNSLRQIALNHDKGNFKNFELEAFASNLIANQWYRKLGMESCGIRNWYIIPKEMIGTLPAIGSRQGKKEYYTIALDEDNFSQVYSNGKHIGTLINNMYLRLNYDCICPQELLKLSVSEICINSRSDFPFPLVDRSIMYRSSFSKMLK